MSYNSEGSNPLIPGLTPSNGLRDCDTQKIPLIPPLAHGIQGKAHVISNLLRALTAYMQVRYGSGERPEDQGYWHTTQASPEGHHRRKNHTYAHVLRCATAVANARRIKATVMRAHTHPPTHAHIQT